MAADVTELTIGGTREDFTAVAIEEFDSMTRFGFHDSFSLLSDLYEERKEDSRERTRKEVKKNPGRSVFLLCWRVRA